LLLFLAPKQYTVRVEKEGLTAPEQAVEVRRGEESRLEFHLAPARASLAVRGAPSGTEVLLDGALIGAVRSEEEGFSFAGINPGRHSVTLRKEGFRPLVHERTFESGKPIQIDGGMQSATGQLKIVVTPAGVEHELRIRHEGDSSDRHVGSGELALAEGNYVVTAVVPQQPPVSTTVRVVAGSTATASLNLPRAEKAQAPARPTVRAFGLDDLAKTGQWKQEGSLLTVQGGEFVLTPWKAGEYTFTAFLTRGRRLEWVVDYRDDKNYCLFRLEEKNLVRARIVNGREAQSSKFPLTYNRKDYVSIRIVAGTDSIAHSVLVGQNWTVLDTWQRTPPEPLEGRFGFHVPGRDQIGLSHFRHVPR
jgi:hypothetical protein